LASTDDLGAGYVFGKVVCRRGPRLKPGPRGSAFDVGRIVVKAVGRPLTIDRPVGVGVAGCGDPHRAVSISAASARSAPTTTHSTAADQRVVHVPGTPTLWQAAAVGDSKRPAGVGSARESGLTSNVSRMIRTNTSGISGLATISPGTSARTSRSPSDSPRVISVDQMARGGKAQTSGPSSTRRSE